MRLEIVLDVWGASPPRKVYHDKLAVRVTEEPIGAGEQTETHHVLEADIDARENPPDQIREEHGLRLPRAMRGQAGIIETHLVEAEEGPKYKKPPIPTPASALPANQASPNAKQIGKRTYATWIEQDYGSLVSGERAGNEGPVVGGDKIGGAKTDVTVLGLPSAEGDGIAPVQPDFLVGENSAYARRDPEQAKAIVEKAIAKGKQVDKVLTENARRAPKPAGRK